MLFVLTGDIQTGKTRWLQSLAADLAAAGVACCGVLAPGVWRERSEEELAAACASGGSRDAVPAASSCGASVSSVDYDPPVRFEKLGIDNVLLPSGERVPFARRRDLALAEGSFVKGSQSARAKLGWEISESAIARVNAHFAVLGEAASGSSPALLIVDELGPLELLRGGGLVEALALLDAGPSERFPNALVIIRESLLDVARERFEGAWGALRPIAPGDEARSAIEGLIFDR